MTNPCYFQITYTSSELDKTPTKFKKDPAKIVGGVAFTRYPVSIYALVEVDPNLTKSKLPKK